MMITKWLVLSVVIVSECMGQWNELKNTVIGSGCLITITPKLTRDCVDAFDTELNSRPKNERDSKVLCCAYLSMQSCVLKIAQKECNEEGESVAKSFIKTINRSITSDDCIDYGIITCITLTQIAIATALVIGLAIILSCICCCCCSSKRRSRVV